MKSIAKAGLIAAALAGTTDAFQPSVPLRPASGARAISSTGAAHRVASINLRQGSARPLRGVTMAMGASKGSKAASQDIRKVAEVQSHTSSPVFFPCRLNCVASPALLHRRRDLGVLVFVCPQRDLEGNHWKTS